MARTAAPVTPGEAPKSDPVLEEVGAALLDAGLEAEVAKGEASDLAATVAAMAARMNRLEAENARLAANQRVQASSKPEPVKLPSMSSVLADGTPTTPVLTSEGWFVPAVMPNSFKV